jgi:hypothetical protein
VHLPAVWPRGVALARVASRVCKHCNVRESPAQATVLHRQARLLSTPQHGRSGVLPRAAERRGAGGWRPTGPSQSSVCRDKRRAQLTERAGWTTSRAAHGAGARSSTIMQGHGGTPPNKAGSTSLRSCPVTFARKGEAGGSDAVRACLSAIELPCRPTDRPTDIRAAVKASCSPSRGAVRLHSLPLSLNRVSHEEPR